MLFMYFCIWEPGPENDGSTGSTSEIACGGERRISSGQMQASAELAYIQPRSAQRPSDMLLNVDRREVLRAHRIHEEPHMMTIHTAR